MKDQSNSNSSFIESLALKLTGQKEVQTNKNWNNTPETWACPCCKRTKLHILRPSQAGKLIGNLINHHDHISAYVQKEFREQVKSLGRKNPSEKEGWFVNHKIIPFLNKFDRTLVCEDCNNADPKAKALISDICQQFSFSPQEMAVFITPKPHTTHAINKERLHSIYEGIRSSHEYRKSLGKSLISRLLCNSRHWGDRVNYPSIKHYIAHEKIRNNIELEIPEIADIFKGESDTGTILFSKVIQHFEAKAHDSASISNEEKLTKRENRRRRKAARLQQKIDEGLFNHGEIWLQDDLITLQSDYENGMSFIELGIKNGRKPNNIKSKLRTLGYDIP